MMPWYLNIWKFKIISKTKELLKCNKKTFFVILQVLSFGHTEQTSKNVADTTFKSQFYINIVNQYKCINTYSQFNNDTAQKREFVKLYLAFWVDTRMWVKWFLIFSLFTAILSAIITPTYKCKVFITRIWWNDV